MSQDRPSSVETRALTIHVSDRVFAGLVDHGRKVGYTPTLMAKTLFEAPRPTAISVKEGGSDSSSTV